MLGRIIEIIRYVLYGIVVTYNASNASWQTTVGFILAFLYIEICIYQINILTTKIEDLEEFIDEHREQANVGGITHPQMDFGYQFSYAPLTKEEEDLIQRAEKGDIDGIESFLASRCKDKSADFTTVPIPVKLIMTAKILALVHSQKDNPESEWDDVLEDTSENN